MAEVVEEIGGIFFLIAILLLIWGYYTYSMGYREHKLKKLRKLLQGGLITQEDYDKTKDTILKGIAEQPNLMRLFGKK